jgi:hypothetical protein
METVGIYFVGGVTYAGTAPKQFATAAAVCRSRRAGESNSSSILIPAFRGPAKHPYTTLPEKAGGTGKVRHGLAFKLRIPYPRAVLQDVSRNGNRLFESETDGYISWKDGSWTIVQVNVPPGADHELTVVTVAYDPVDIRLEGVFDPVIRSDADRVPLGPSVGQIRPLQGNDNAKESGGL